MNSERKHVTVMFSDMSGYTAMTERLDPEEVKGIMSDIFGKITAIIKRYDGFIERFIGDAVMAVFGVPKAHEDDPIRAIKAALEIHTAVENFSPQHEAKIGHPLSMHTGINTGLVVTGEVDIEKGTHGLTGDAINLASRLESLANSGEIIVGENTFQLSKHNFKFQTMEPVQIKGKTGQVSVYKVISVLDQEAVTQQMQGVQAELVGRETEMHLLVKAIENLKQGMGSIISIVGHAGTGKSRLTREFKKNLNFEGLQWREGHAYAYTKNIAYYPLTNLLSHAFQIRDGDSSDQIKEKVDAGVNDLLWDKPEAKKYLGSLFSLSYDEIDEMSPEFWQKQLHQSAQQLLESLASRGPTVLLFEDLHWADSAFIELLHLLLENTQRPVLFLCVYRPSFDLFPKGESKSLVWSHQKIELRDLSWDQTQEMLQSLLDSPQIPDELRYFIQQKVEGNPFYLEEVINTLIETGSLVSDGDNWQITRSLDLEDVPTTIQGVLAARLDRLENQAKRILQEASVIGRAFFYKVLTRITEMTTPVDGYLSGLENLDLIRARSKEPDLEYIFKHALTQEVVYNGLLIKERQEIHERIGLAIEQVFTDRLPEFYETLAFHFKRGQSVHKSVYYLIKSGEKNLNRYALAEADQYFNEAFDLLALKPDKSREDERLLVQTLIKWAYVFYYYGKYKDLAKLFKANITIAEAQDDKELLGMFYAWLGFMLYGIEELNDSYQYLLKALELGNEIESLKVKGYAFTWLSWNCAERGFLEEAVSHGNAAQQMASSLVSDPYLFFKSLAGIGHAYYFSGKTGKNIDIGRILLDYGDKYSNIRCMVLGYVSLGHEYVASGFFPRAIEQYQKAVSVSVDPMYSQFANLFLGLAYAQNGQFNIAEQVLEEVLSYSQNIGFKGIGTPAAAFLGAIYVAKGDMSNGFKKMEAVGKGWLETDRRACLPIFECLVGTVYLKIIEGAAPVSIQSVIKNIGFIIKNVPFAVKKAEYHFNKALGVAKEIGAVGIIGQSYLNLGFLYRSKKRNEMARDYFRKAIEIFEEIEAEGFLKQSKDALNSLG
ncbi:AAA family ATPase [Desulfobacterales bacterium]|nr:AAA family ATPase [Desulfobacterales bacterium]